MWRVRLNTRYSFVWCLGFLLAPDFLTRPVTARTIVTARTRTCVTACGPWGLRPLSIENRPGQANCRYAALSNPVEVSGRIRRMRSLFVESRGGEGRFRIGASAQSAFLPDR